MVLCDQDCGAPAAHFLRTRYFVYPKGDPFQVGPAGAAVKISYRAVCPSHSTLVLGMLGQGHFV